MSDILPIATPRRTWCVLREIARPHRWLATWALAAVVGATAVGMLVPAILGHVVNVVLDGDAQGAISTAALVLLGVALAVAVLGGIGAIGVARLGETMLATLREGVVLRALDLPLGQVEATGSGDIIARVSGDVAVVAAAVRTAIPNLIKAGLTIAFTLASLAVLDWRLALAGAIAAPIQVFALHWYLRRSTPLFASARRAEAIRTQRILDAARGAETIRSFRLTNGQVERIEDGSLASVDYAMATTRLSTRFFGQLNLAEAVGLTSILTVGFLLVGAEQISVGATAAAALYFHRIFDPVNVFLGLFGTAQEAAAGLARLVGIADAAGAASGGAADGTDADRAVAAPKGAPLRVDGVSFRYGSGPMVLHEVTLQVAPGEHVALVGQSGAGKTTLSSLVAGIHRPTHGELTIGRTPISDIAPDLLRSSVALVSQEVHVFAGNVADNLRLARATALDADLLGALEQVKAISWVNELPEGIQTMVGEGGHPLTSTQAQHLALARVVLADPDIIVLDEATADSGSAGARLLDEAARRALAGRTAIIVAHRLSQAAVADRILVMEGGRVIEEGTHRDLVALGGAYAALWQGWARGRGATVADDQEAPGRSRAASAEGLSIAGACRHEARELAGSVDIADGRLLVQLGAEDPP